MQTTGREAWEEDVNDWMKNFSFEYDTLQCVCGEWDSGSLPYSGNLITVAREAYDHFADECEGIGTHGS